MNCVNCGKSIESKRSDAIYCSVECRDDFNNKRKRIDRLAGRAEYCIQEIATMCVETPSLNPDGINAIKRIVGKVS